MEEGAEVSRGHTQCYLKEISCGDIQGIYTLHVSAYKVLVLPYIGYRVRVLLVF